MFPIKSRLREYITMHLKSLWDVNHSVIIDGMSFLYIYKYTFDGTLSANIFVPGNPFIAMTDNIKWTNLIQCLGAEND